MWLNGKKKKILCQNFKLEWGHSDYPREKITELSQKVFMLDSNVLRATLKNT